LARRSCHHYVDPCSVARAIPRWSTPLDDVDQRSAKRIRSSGLFGEGNTVPGGWICTHNVTFDFIGGTDITLLQHMPLPWLKELHSKIWKHEELRSTLFRTKVVTRAHYDALQDSLNRKHPDRDLEEYDGRHHDVLSDKLDILKPITGTAAEALSVDDDVDMEASNEVDSEINSLFPYTLRYLDLSTLELENKLDRFPLPFLLRQEYDHISDLIRNSPRNGKGSIIVSGQPGTGEVLVSLSRMI
jgi:hypothetical protein